MAYSAMVLRMLVSCPCEVTKDDLTPLHQVINRWKVLLGEQFDCIIIPVTWNEHSAAEFGEASAGYP